MTNDREEAIAARAYELWTESGYEHGHDKQHWQQAERELGGAVQTESITGSDHRHNAGVSGAAPTQNDQTGILHHVP